MFLRIKPPGAMHDVRVFAGTSFGRTGGSASHEGSVMVVKGNLVSSKRSR